MTWNGSKDGGIVLHDFNTRKEIEIKVDNPKPKGSKMEGHGGSDFMTMNAITKAVANNDKSLIKTGIMDSLRSHKLVFAAERSRLNDTIEYVTI